MNIIIHEYTHTESEIVKSNNTKNTIKECVMNITEHNQVYQYMIAMG